MNERMPGEQEQSTTQDDEQRETINREGITEDLRRAADDIAQAVEMTNKLESAIECDKSEETLSSHPAKLTRRGFLKLVGIGAAAVVGGAGLYKSGKEVSKVEKGSKGKIIEKRTGVDMEKIAEQNNFSAEMEIDNGTGPYIIHIGQVHEPPTGSDVERSLFKRKVIAVQKNIEKITLDLQGGGACDEVCVEGYTTKILLSYLAYISDVRKKTSETQPTVEAFCVKARELERLSMLAAVGMEVGKADGVDCYILFKEMEKMEKYFQKNPPKFKKDENGIGQESHQKTEEEKFAKAVKLLEDARSGKNELLSLDGIYRAGAELKLLIDGKIKINPAEDETVINKAVDALREVEKQVALEGKNELVEANKRFASFAFRPREDAAVNFISKTETGGKKLILLVYGSGHNFKDAVDAYNKANPKRRFGLIKLTPNI